MSSDPSPARDWAARLASRDPQISGAAAGELIRGGPEALPLLKRFFRLNNPRLHARSFEVLRHLGKDAAPLLADLLKSGQPDVRLGAVDLLIDLAPDTVSVQAAIGDALRDSDVLVARDAARALGALGELAAPSVPVLVAALDHDDAHLRIYATEALASIGPKAASATHRLAQLLDDGEPGVRWAACEALSGIGPAAASATPRLIAALRDDNLYVRICAAGALGSMGQQASAAVEPLRQAAHDPSLRAEAQWALQRITGAPHNDPSPSAIEPPPSPSSDHPPTSLAPTPPSDDPSTKNLPLDWDYESGRNIAWREQLGGETFGRPVLADGVIYIGTDNQNPRNPAFRDECGVLMAFRADDGKFLWQDLAPRVDRGLRQFLMPSTASAAHVEGDRLYYITAECQLRCLDTRGFKDGENDGAHQSEPFKDEHAADIVWELDICGRLGVFVHESANSEVLPIGDLLVVCTSNGRNEGHTRVPSPRAPSLIAVNKHTGEVVWRATGAGEHVLHGQWCSPVAANVNGRTQVLFGGGDGWLRAYDAGTGREIWRFDGNPKDAVWRPRPGVFSRSAIVASPVYHDGRVFIAMGDDPSHGDGPSLVHAVSPGGHGDVTQSRLLWTSREVGRVVGTPTLHDGLLYIADLGGNVHCLDAATGDHLWKHSIGGPIWGCLLRAGDRLYAGNTEGNITVLRTGRRKQVLAEFEVDAALYARPTVSGDRLFLATATRLYLIAAASKTPAKP